MSSCWPTGALSAGGAKVHTVKKVKPAYRQLLGDLPRAPSRFTLYFDQGTTRITDASRPTLAKVRTEVASRADLLDHVEATFGVRVSRVALYKFLKRYGLDRIHAPATPAAAPTPEFQEPPHAGVITSLLVPAPVTTLPPLSTRARSTPGPSC